jgi:hypothetical protein
LKSKKWRVKSQITAFGALVITPNQSFNAHDFKFWAKKKPCELQTPTGFEPSPIKIMEFINE